MVAESTQTVADTSCVVVVVEHVRCVVRAPGAGSDGLSEPTLARAIERPSSARNVTSSPSSSTDQATGYSNAIPHLLLVNVFEPA